MLKQCVDIFIGNSDEKELITNIKLKDGYYALITKDKKTNEFVFDIDNSLEVNKKSDGTDELYRKITVCDYYSNSLKNKAIVKNTGVLSNNYYSFFVNANALDDNRINDKEINLYFSTLENIQNKYSGIQRELYMYVKENMVGEINKEELNSIKEFMLSNYLDIIEHLKSRFNYKLKSTKVFRMLFDVSESDYKREFNRYYYLNCFATADSILKQGDNFFGAPAIDFTLNSKKPFLRNYTRKTDIPYLTEFKDTLTATLFNKYLDGFLPLKYKNYYFDTENEKMYKFKDSDFKNKFFNRDFQGIYLKYENASAKSKNITQLEHISLNAKDFDDVIVDGNKLFKINEKFFFIYKVYNSRGALLNIVNLVCFGGKLFPKDITKEDENKDELDIKWFPDYDLDVILEKYKANLYNWVFKQDDESLKAIYKNMFQDIMFYSFDKNDYYNVEIKLPNIINLYFAVNKFLGGNDMQKNNLENYDNLRNKIDNKRDFTFANDEEFCFAVGHISKYLLAQSKSENSKYLLFKPFFSLRTLEAVQFKVKQLYKQYMYDVTYPNADRLISAVISYTRSSKNNFKLEEDALISGYLTDNLLFRKNIKKAEVEKNVK